MSIAPQHGPFLAALPPVRDDAPSPGAGQWSVWARAGVGFALCTAVGLAFAAHWRALGPPVEWATVLREMMPRWYVWGALAPLVARSDQVVAHRVAAGRALGMRIRWHLPLALAWTATAVAAQVALRAALGGPAPASWLEGVPALR